jgi:hypothetical protein
MPPAAPGGKRDTGPQTWVAPRERAAAGRVVDVHRDVPALAHATSIAIGVEYVW